MRLILSCIESLLEVARALAPATFAATLAEVEVRVGLRLVDDISTKVITDDGLDGDAMFGVIFVLLSTYCGAGREYYS